MNEEEIYEMILNEDVEKYSLLNEIFAIRDNRHKVNNYTICVNGYISLDVINKAIKLQKENEELKSNNEKYTIHLTNKQYNAVIENAKNDINQKWIQKVKDKIEELQKEYNKLDKQVDEYIKSVEKDVSTYYENKERISIMQTLSYFIDTLKELIEEREEK